MQLIDKIRQAGVVGCGGAGFPTHMKLKPNMEYFIINGAECEPLLRTDRYFMKHKADNIISAIDLISKEFTPENVVIGLKSIYKEEIRSLQAAIEKAGSKIRIFQTGSYYPAGDEQILVHEVTGRSVPPLGIPLNVGAMVSNIGTMYQVSEAIRNKPFTTKYLTVTGEVEKPVIIEAPIGTSFSDCINIAKPTISSYYTIEGGPMMGKIVDGEKSLSKVITKTTSGIVVIGKDSYLAKRKITPINNIINVARSVCMQCSACTSMCPRHLIGHPLQPHKIMRAVSEGRGTDDYLQNPVIKQALICSECGICEEYACPMGLSPRKINQYLKGNLIKAGIKYDNSDKPVVDESFIEYRKIPSKRIAARVGVMKYYDYDIDNQIYLDAKTVNIPLKQHVGAAAEPVVTVGQRVKAGEVIGKIPEGQLGAMIHASISGVVKAINHSVRIEKE